MSERISINIESLGLNATHNYIVPEDMNVAKLTELIIKTLLDEYPGINSKKNGVHLLMQSSTGKVLNNGCSLKQMGVVSGETFILI